MAAAVCRKCTVTGLGVLTFTVFQCHIMISVYKYAGHTENRNLIKGIFDGWLSRSRNALKSADEHFNFPLFLGLYSRIPIKQGWGSGMEGERRERMNGKGAKRRDMEVAREICATAVRKYRRNWGGK
jgi:hypothetical protein